MVVCATLLALALDSAGAPAPTLFGGLVTAAAVGILGRWPVTMPPLSMWTAQGVIGVTVAAQLDGSSLARVGEALPAVIGVTLATVALSVLAGLPLMLHGVGLVTSVFASVAGGAASTSAMAKDFGADDRVVVVVQFFRLLVIMATLPLVAVLVFGAEGPNSARRPLFWAGVEPASLLILAAVILGGIKVGSLTRIPAGALMVPMIFSLVLSAAAPSVQLSVPPVCLAGALMVLGAHAGLGFRRETLLVLLRLFPMVIFIVAVVLIGCAGLGVWLSAATGQSPLSGYLATSPGGLPVVLATAQSGQADITFISAVQILRLLVTMAAMPLCIAGLRTWWGRRN
jgi:membrane AbrB-like protein